MNNIGFPKNIFSDYSTGAITRSGFIKKIGDWQKSNGNDLTCKGYMRNGKICVLYRGIKGEIRNGLIFWPDEANHEHLAQSIFYFKRSVDNYKARAR